MTGRVAVPPLWQSLALAVLARKPPPRAERELALERASYEVDGPSDVGHALARFFDVRIDPIPLVAWYVVAQRVQLAYMTSPSFPFSAIGTIHVANTIELFDRVDPSKRLQAEVRVGSQSLTASGRRFSLIVTLENLGGRVVVSSDYIARDPRLRSERGSATEQADPPAGKAETIEFPADLGRRYARVSGDYNPIHLATPLARPFGFKRAIAHGMCTFGFASAILARRSRGEQRLGQVAFKRPISLPSHPGFFVGSREAAAFDVWSDDLIVCHASGSFRMQEDS